MNVSMNLLSQRYSQTSELIESGVDLNHAYEILLGEGNLKRVDVQKGFTENLKRSKAVPPLDLVLLSAAEKAGKLPSTLKDLSENYSDQYSYRKTTLEQTNYPLILMAMAYSLQYLPQVVKGDITVEQFFTKIIFVIGGGFALYLLFRRKFLSKSLNPNQESYDFLNGIPFISGIYKSFQIFWFYNILYFFTEVGLGPIKGIEFFMKEQKNSFLGKDLSKQKNYLAKAPSITDFLSRFKYFKKDLSQIKTGEQSGTLPNSFKVLKLKYQNQNKEKMKTLSFWIPKIVYLIFVLFFAYQMISSFTARLEGLDELIGE